MLESDSRIERTSERCSVGRMASEGRETKVNGAIQRVAVLTADYLGPAMAGPAIRAWHIAAALSKENEVRLATTGPCEMVGDSFPVQHADGIGIEELESWADVIVFQGFLMHEHPVLARSEKILVVDIYDPVHLEQLEQARDLGEQIRRETVRAGSEVLNQQIRRGDFFLCASEKQRDFWLGAFGAAGRINPQNYDADPQLRSLLAVVPFGLEDSEAVPTERMVRGVIPGINEGDRVVLWGGGIYNWFDPLTLIRAIDLARAEVPNIRLLFMGVRHPNPNVPEMRMAVAARQLAESLEILNTHVFFHEEWVPYAQRCNFLLESDIGVSCHLDHIETSFSFRTRILDYLWTALPIVCTQGDSFAELVEDARLGRTVAPGDVQGLSDALVWILTHHAEAAGMRDRERASALQFTWPTVLDPLVRFCRNPHRAADFVDPLVMTGPPSQRSTEPTSPRRLFREVIEYERSGGIKLVVKKAVRKCFRAVPSPLRHGFSLVLFGRNGRAGH